MRYEAPGRKKRSERQHLLEVANKAMEENEKLRGISSRLLHELKSLERRGLLKEDTVFLRTVIDDCEKELRKIYE